MSNVVKFNFDTREFNAALSAMSNVSEELPSKIVNKKTFFIFRSAAKNMKVVEKEQIAKELGAAPAHVLVKLKNGNYSRAKSRVKNFFGEGDEKGDFNLLAAIVQSRAKKSGKPSPWAGVDRATGAQRMLEAMRVIYSSRQKARGYFQKGFVSLRYIFKKAWGKAGGDFIGGSVNKLEKIANGSPAASRQSKAVASFWMVSPKHDIKDALDKYASPVLQRAFDEESEDTFRAAAEKEYKDALKFIGIKVS